MPDSGNRRFTLRSNPSAVSGYDETKADLLSNTSGNYSYLRDSNLHLSLISHFRDP